MRHLKGTVSIFLYCVSILRVSRNYIKKRKITDLNLIKHVQMHRNIEHFQKHSLLKFTSETKIIKMSAMCQESLAPSSGHNVNQLLFK